MAFTSSGFVEVRDTGAADNGGYWNPNIVGAGTDYTQADLPIASGADGDCNNSTTFTANGSTPFTAQMVGNAIHISGAGYTTSWYEIRTFNSTSSVVLDRNPTSAGGHPTTGAYKIGGAITDPSAGMFALLASSSITYVKKGTYSWGTSAVNLSTNACAGGVRGYKTTRDDNPSGSDRPTITLTGAMTVGNNSVLKDLIITTSIAADAITGGNACSFINLKVSQTAASTRTAIFTTANTASLALGCEVNCTNGYGFNSITRCVSCYAHDSVHGFWMGNPCTCVNCVADTCSTAGFKAATATGSYGCINCDAYNCGIGFDAAANATDFDIINCIGKSNTTGILGTLSFRQVVANSVLNNTTDMTNVYADYKINNSLSDPALKDPANGDFTIVGSSPAYNKSLGIGTNVGAVGSYYLSSGVSQVAGFTGQVMSVS